MSGRADGGAGGGGLRRPPAKWDDLRFVLLVAVATIAVMSCVGWLLVHPLAGSVGDLDDRIARWFAARRSSTLDDLTWLGSASAEAVVRITGAAVLSLLFLRWWRRWNEVALLVGALVLEVTVFLVSTFVVDRPRPPVTQLDSIPPTSSYPSGHVAATVVFYGALAIIVWWHTRSRIARGVALAGAIVLPPIVGISRMYRGMHYLSDVVVGTVVGVVSLWAVYRAVRVPRPNAIEQPGLGTPGALRGSRRRTNTAESPGGHQRVPRRGRPARALRQTRGPGAPAR
jgi:membrane-associated phospholipid phosphatase